jgi:hypothetical protein
MPDPAMSAPAAPALARLRAAGAGRILSSDSIPHSTNGLDLAPHLARALQDEGYA